MMGVQMGLTPDKDDNLRRATDMIAAGIKSHRDTDLICLPEVWYSMPTPKNKEYVGESIDSEVVMRLRACAADHHVNIITGTLPILNGGSLYNTCLCIDRTGSIIAKYSKTHLFDAFNVKESDTVSAGSEVCIADFDFGKVGIAVCYELRFPEYLRTIALKGADILAVPAAFYQPRGDHFTLLTRAAALQNLMYVFAVNQSNDRWCGRSSIIDPNGVVTAGASDGENLFFGIADMEYQNELRRKVPVFENRRPDLYQL